ncbi:MAG: hypothetical protein NZ583_04115 [Desulfobacterota bacterium]|nr:hypothetical protein [Thermodesulfobacteriota bacterium]MDW8001546.1 hypothetical protein [Deltaproteobacteria bacterium]
MAEIKSSIEIAMEKTKHLIMSEEERREQERKDLENRTRITLRKFKEKYLDRDDVIREFESLKDKSQKKIFIEVLLDELDPMEESEHILSILELIDERTKRMVEEILSSTKKAFKEELEKREMIVRERIRQRLKEEGLEGDSIIINISSWPEYDEALSEVQNIFRRRMETWKERVLSELPI